MFLFLACLRARVAAAQCHDAEPHLQKREWVDGDRHCSYRESVIFESLGEGHRRRVEVEPLPPCEEGAAADDTSPAPPIPSGRASEHAPPLPAHSYSTYPLD